MLAQGSSIPGTTFYTMGPSGPVSETLTGLSSGRRIAVFAVPGAFTPTCSRSHLPGFISRAYDLERAGIAQIICISTADVYVMSAWGKASYVGERITMLSDGDGEFARASGMTVDFTGHGFGVRSKRYAMVVQNGTVETILVESDPMAASESSADALLRAIARH